VIQADTVEEMVDLLVTLSFLSPPKGRRVGVVGAGGGGSVSLADECEKNGLTVPPLPSDIVAELKRLFPQDGSLIKNPIDVSVMAEGAGIMLEPLLYAMELIAKHPDFDLLICDTSVERVLESIEWQGMFQGIVSMFIKIGKESKKPMAVVMRSADSPEEWRWKSIIAERERCIQAGFPTYPTIARAAKAISEVVKYNLANATRRLGGKINAGS
jgi:acyl-CoA synthetase (NDP forming)